jgi:3-methyladenine DNA glycosylase AlkD
MPPASTPPPVQDLVARLRRLGSPRNVAGMSRYGITGGDVLGVPAPALRRLARELGRDHGLAARLWATGIHEARLLAALVEQPERVTALQMDRWAADFDNWALCDGCCLHLFDHTRFAHAKAAAWSRRRAEFVKRAGFALMAVLAVHDKAAPDAAFLRFLPLVERGAADPRNAVKKAANWALRQIGKRNLALHAAALGCAEAIHQQGTPQARWIASDALRELRSPAVRERLSRRPPPPATAHG